jgi:hypothetical protein
VNTPTQDDLINAAGHLEALAYAHDPRNARNATGFPDVAMLLDLLVWIDGEIKAAREAAAYGPGNEGGYQTLARGQISDIDSRTRDQLLKDLRRLRMGWLHKLGQLVDEFKQEGYEVARWPTRSEQVG